ncbi:LysR family transcriptional regulator, regulator for metE and metH [Verrucomicrobium sp. GAS474]|uniref:LysR family transcriptional regulator n=1 Tax=Verrucomicrobium sp. GAS474 TaxID=1882831 RepID=UPI0008797A47|nr:LysR family transcriptional regulator [Verrucomicrobium sp. GAS474]SDT91986.1 LysR family transcriptional regulator, regulator for metE and metH [Verrucomicrobium sp. GAS474]
MIELRHFHTLIALAETGNLSKAARRVHLSQPAASHQIRAVESHYGVEVFERKSDPLRLTAAGRLLVELAYDVSKRVRDGERDLARIAQGQAGRLRIAVECHSCFDWLMPSMDAFREHWPQVEMDLVSGFHADPVGLLNENRADLVIVSHTQKREGVVFHPLFGYEMLAILGKHHPLTRKPYLTAKDFKNETLVTYPIPDDRLDLVREVLIPAKVDPVRRKTELTVAILQLVASGQGVAALPGWTIQPYLDKKYVVGKQIGKSGLQSRLYTATTLEGAKLAYMEEFLRIMREISFATLQGIEGL